MDKLSLNFVPTESYKKQVRPIIVAQIQRAHKNGREREALKNYEFYKLYGGKMKYETILNRK